MLELERYLDQQREVGSNRSFERIELIRQIFDNTVDFLRDEKRFPNPEINGLATLMWKLIGNRHILTVVDSSNRDSFRFVVAVNSVNRQEQQPFLVVPANLPEITKYNPAALIGIFVYMASQCRDWWCNKIAGENEEEIDERARAYEAEALLTLKDLAEEGEVFLDLPEVQKRRLEEFPLGLKSLQSKLCYETPEYSPIRSGDPRLN